MLGLCERLSGFRRPFRRLCLWPQNSVSRQQRPRQAETGSNAVLPRGKAENLVLLAPFGGQVGEASNPHAMRQPPAVVLLLILRLVVGGRWGYRRRFGRRW